MYITCFKLFIPMKVHIVIKFTNHDTDMEFNRITAVTDIVIGFRIKRESRRSRNGGTNTREIISGLL